MGIIFLEKQVIHFVKFPEANVTTELLIHSLQNKVGNIANFVLAVPLEMN